MESKKFKIIQLSITAILLAACFCLEWFLGIEHGNKTIPNWGLLLIYLVPYIFISFNIFIEMIEDFKEKEIFSEEFLMTIATLGALSIGFIPGAKNMFAEAVLVMELFQLGELLEDIASDRSKKSILSLLKSRPDYAYEIINGQVIKTKAQLVKIGSILLVKPGDIIPLDGIIIEGETKLNMVSITGESLPKTFNKGQQVISGCINLSNPIKIKTISNYKNSTISKIIDLVENSNDKKSKTTRFITKFSKYYTPIVVFSAILIALIGCLVTKQYAKWLTVAMTCLIISCPCALVISVPLCFFVSIGISAKKGILIKGANTLEQLSNIKTLVFDKTGTLTYGNFKVSEVYCLKDKNKMISIAKGLELNSNHPIAKVLNEYMKDIKPSNLKKVRELPGFGMTGLINKSHYYLGNEKLMNKLKIKFIKPKNVGTIVYFAKDKEFMGYFVLADQIKPDSYKAMKQFKHDGIKTVMLSGDSNLIANSVAKKLNIACAYGQLFPIDKITKLEEIIKQKNKNEMVAFVGDGINDSPSISRADIGISMGAIGSSAAIEASDIVLTQDKLSKISLAMKISKRSKLISKENIVFALTIKIAVLILAIFSLTPMWLAIFADVGVTILAILNSMRCSKIK